MQLLPGKARRGLLFAALFLLPWAAMAQEIGDIYEPDCMPLKIEGKHGPFDYRKTTQAERTLVEQPHFTEHYRAYQLGKRRFKISKSGIIETPAAGFGYTLWAFPNHYLSLIAVEDLGYRQKKERLDGLPLRVHCYFQRAVKFVPDDGLVRALYGYYQSRRGNAAEADWQLAQAIEIKAEDRNVLVYSAFARLELGQPEAAVELARKAYALGYNLPGLRERLARAGHPLEPLSKQ